MIQFHGLFLHDGTILVPGNRLMSHLTKSTHILPISIPSGKIKTTKKNTYFGQTLNIYFKCGHEYNSSLDFGQRFGA
uniref:Uncharacterized protein n=1 Tax=Candidatus Kentrum sp. FW TaxID=2126338 RepID=A0A450TVK0_9GAMM|nr:MAG: hypothetical protein BECKFW1821C_GA0114237_104221 [Candidatus Kentron sp. FW]